LRVLLSAYACEPAKGSEPGIGWHWAVEIARLGHEVHIVTRTNNVNAIRAGLAAIPELRLTVHGYDLPQWMRWWKKGKRGIRLYYVLWQWGAYRFARRLHASAPFDLAHHITFGVFRHPSFMGRLGIPFVFGPVGGGESSPRALLQSLPWRGRLAERLRAAANHIASFDPLVRGTMRRAILICCNTKETMMRIPPRYRGKTICVHDVAVDSEGIAGAISLAEGAEFLFVGRLLYWKGIHLALRALAQLRIEGLEARLTVIGDGSARAWLENLAHELTIEGAVSWRGWLARGDALAAYANHAAFVFPSLHDSGGTVVMEAMAQGLPVVCLDLGGPGEILPAGCGFKIHARDCSELQVVAELAGAMRELASNQATRREVATNALSAARGMTWTALVSQAYEEVERTLGQK
jgi:glycosyltransferase involved in cell wall biosynthesis